MSREVSFRLAPLAPEHDRSLFDSGSAPLDRYLREQATQDIRRRVTACFVALFDNRIAGYYTLASASLLLTDLPDRITKKLPRYPTVPAIRMGRLAVDRSFKGQGWGRITGRRAATCRSFRDRRLRFGCRSQG
jgi:hypothetical protein